MIGAAIEELLPPAISAQMRDGFQTQIFCGLNITGRVADHPGKPWADIPFGNEPAYQLQLRSSALISAATAILEVV